MIVHEKVLWSGRYLVTVVQVTYVPLPAEGSANVPSMNYHFLLGYNDTAFFADITGK